MVWCQKCSLHFLSTTELVVEKCTLHTVCCVMAVLCFGKPYMAFALFSTMLSCKRTLFHLWTGAGIMWRRAVSTSTQPPQTTLSDSNIFLLLLPAGAVLQKWMFIKYLCSQIWLFPFFFFESCLTLRIRHSVCYCIALQPVCVSTCTAWI